MNDPSITRTLSRAENLHEAIATVALLCAVVALMGSVVRVDSVNLGAHHGTSSDNERVDTVATDGTDDTDDTVDTDDTDDKTDDNDDTDDSRGCLAGEEDDAPSWVPASREAATHSARFAAGLRSKQ